MLYLQKRDNITQAQLTIYDSISVGDPRLWFTNEELCQALATGLIGLALDGLALKTRSKRVKEVICTSLGYPIPKTFRKNHPRFSGQKFDTYIQKANNLQIWNEDVDPERRYVIIIVDKDDIISNVHTLGGVELALLDNTGTLTQKYQARLTQTDSVRELISPVDTDIISRLIPNSQADIDLSKDSPINQPVLNKLLPISTIFDRVYNLIGSTISHLSFTQERNRGAELHRLICRALGYSTYQDNGQFPDIKHQLLEIKLQTSPTIDLGLVCPDSHTLLDLEVIGGNQIRHCDVRYILLYGKVVGKDVIITNIYLTTGKDFFSRFIRFGGKIINRKAQIRLPQRFFEPVIQQSKVNFPAQGDE